MIQQACAGLLYKPGLGKTSVVYAACRILLDKQFVKKILVICPIRPMYIVWPHQKDDYVEFQDLRVGVMHGKDKDEVLVSDDYDMYVINPEGLPWLFNSTSDKKGVTVDPVRLAWLREKFDMLVVDESTKFRNSQTNRFKLLKKFVPFFKRRYILTGSPRPKNLMDLFGQIYILDEGASLGRYITHYRTNYFYPTGYGGYDWTPQPDALERITDKIAPLVQVVEQKGNIELPEVLINDIWVDLPPEAMRHYRRMEAEMVARLEEGTVVAANAAVASSKCRQIANGGLFGDSGEWQYIHDAKEEALQDLLEQLQGEPVLITYEFKFDAARIHDNLKVPSISTGKVKHDTATIKRFSDGELPAVQGHPDSIALGTDGLQKHCCNICMFGLTWNYLNYEQVIDRIKRTGNKSKHVTVHRILARDTVDERMIAVLDDRETSQKDFMAVLRKVAEGERSKG
jgi:Superfamily II DNA/RNA helicases, SNF2 family